MMKKPFKDSIGLMTFGVGVGVAQSVAPSVNFSPLTSKMPVMGGLIGSGMVLNEVHKMGKKYGCKKKY